MYAIRIITRFKPHIIHFVGHGVSDSTKNRKSKNDDLRDAHLIFHSDDFRNQDNLTGERLKTFFENLLEMNCPVKIVVLNACFAAFQAQAISQVGLTAIGSENKIIDQDARRFAGGFYEEFVRITSYNVCYTKLLRKPPANRLAS